MTSAELGRGAGQTSPVDRDPGHARQQGGRKVPLLLLSLLVFGGFIALRGTQTASPVTGTPLSSLTAMAQQPLTYESTIGWVERPAGLAIGPDQRIYVADSSRRVATVSAFELDGSTAFTLGDGPEGKSVV